MSVESERTEEKETEKSKTETAEKPIPGDSLKIRIDNRKDSMNTAWKKRLSFFVAAGQMTVTNYIMQSVLAILIFKAGVYEQLGTVASFSLCICMCLLQVYYSKWWLSHFKSGPLELLWRKLMSVQLHRETIYKPRGLAGLSRAVEETTFKGISFMRQNAFVNELQQKEIKEK